MKITAFNGSPRAEKGDTHIIVEEFLNGALEAGAEVENIFLSHKNIKHCIGCFSCWLRTPGKCAVEDDMRELLPKYMASDIVVFATPVYVDNVTGIMKDFIDRLIPLGDPHFEADENGETRHIGGKGSPSMVVISSCGFPEQSHFQVLHHLFQRVARNFHSEVIAEIYRSEGGILKEPPSELKPIIWKYRKLVKRAGRELVEDLSISEDTASKLENPLIPYDQYLKGANEKWDRILSAK